MSCCDDNTGMALQRLSLTAVDGAMSVDVTGVTVTLTIAVPGGGRFKYDIWLSDSATNPTETSNPPSSVITRWQGYTDANGNATIAFTHTGPVRSWYLWGTFIFLNVSDVATVGV